MDRAATVPAPAARGSSRGSARTAEAAEPKSVSGPRQFTDTCRVAGSPADPSRTTHQDELRRAPRVVDGNDAGTRSSCAAKAAARPVPLKRAERPQFTDTRAADGNAAGPRPACP